MKHRTQPGFQEVFYEQQRIRLEQEWKELEQAISVTEKQRDRELLLENSSHYRQRLKAVVQGLDRIQDRTFGLCVRCKNRIGQKRLSAIPSAQYCINCQLQSEQDQMSRGLLRKDGV